MGIFADLRQGHQALKERIHATRIPLGTPGRVGMGLFYLVSPVVAGYFIMQWTNKISERNLGVYTNGTATQGSSGGKIKDTDASATSSPKLQQSPRVKKYVEMQKRELGALLSDIEADHPTGDWRRGPPSDLSLIHI